jgi:exopolyphosphatase/guanosine-5'-triphosphate,3'-diphosphate pyrophosphatase
MSPTSYQTAPPRDVTLQSSNVRRALNSVRRTDSLAGVRVAIVDIGTNSTRLLIADVAGDGALAVLHRESIVTRLGERVDATGRLCDDAIERVLGTLAHYRRLIDAHGATATAAVLTSAVRDASNGAELTALVRERYGLDARTIGGDEEAALTFAGATSERADGGREIVVVDIGGGSTEFVIGVDGVVGFHVSTQAGVVRQTERHLHSDPPRREDVRRLRAEVAGIFDESVPPARRERVRHAIAVAGTPTSCAAIELELDPYDRARVHGHTLTRATCQRILDRLARLTERQRRAVTGLQPDRAPTIVAGVAMLLEVFDLFGLGELEVSEHDLLRGAALRLAGASRTRGV